jgi:predicted RNA-binding Zn ribbon-like protein
VVQSFLNSRWNLNRDHEEQLKSPSALAAWLEERGLVEPGTRLGKADLARAVDVREGLRALLFVNNGAPPDEGAIERLNGALAGSRLSVRFEPTGSPALASRAGGLDSALASLASIVAAAQVDGNWLRLKACPGRHCGWAFYDHSRNRSGSWCSMSLCGSRSKAREYRRRNRARTSS